MPLFYVEQKLLDSFLMKFNPLSGKGRNLSRCNFEGCVLIRGEGLLPFSFLEDVKEEFAPNSDIIFNFGVAYRLGMAAAIGTRESFERLVAAKPPACDVVLAEIDAARKLGLGEDAVRWLDGWSRTTWATSVFQYLTGVDCGSGCARPHFPDSVTTVLCIELLRSEVGVINDRFGRLAELGKPWKELCSRWSHVLEILEDEDDREARMKEFLCDCVRGSEWAATGDFVDGGALS